MQSAVAEMERGRWQPCLDVINAAETDPIYLRGRGVESLTRESKVGGGQRLKAPSPPDLIYFEIMKISLT